MEKILIKHITDLLELIQQDNIRPEKFGNGFMMFEDFQLYLCNKKGSYTCQIVMLVLGEDKYKIDNQNLVKLYEDTINMLESKRDTFEKEKLDKIMKRILTKLQR